MNENLRAEVIAIGDELTSGQRLDTNSQWISQRLGEMGIASVWHTTVADDLAANIEVFRIAAARADLVLCTGGLGPTADDLTRQAIAEAAGVPLVKDEGALEHIQALFARHGREMPARNEIQAMFPEGSRVVPNPHGTAPGIDLDWPMESKSASPVATDGPTPRIRVIALPGVPAEMKEMWELTIGPSLRRQVGAGRVTRHDVIKCFGVGESDLEQRLPDLVQRGRIPSVGITVHKATITLRITATADSPEDCEALIAPTRNTIHECLGQLVFGVGADELQDVVVRELLQLEATLWVIEGGTGGLLCDWLSQADPQRRVFRGGVVDCGLSVDAEPLLQQVRAACKARRACWVLGVGGFPEPPGRFAIVLGNASTGELEQWEAPYAGHPDILRERSAKQALDRLRLALRES
ncbi:MAG: damage-inducible protein CinA [Planctomycetales bacterium]|nr:damage-inducible protein CinA [Planctomycetales bacterium]